MELVSEYIFHVELIYLYFSPSFHHAVVVLGIVTSIPTRPVDNVVITTKGLQERKIHILDGTTVENKGKLILIEKLDQFQIAI